jgi:hypothetical protein
MDKWKNKQFRDNLRAQLKEKGLCIRCKKPRSNKSICYCDDCLLKNKLANTKQRQKLKETGICLWCRVNKSETKSGYCKSCYKKLIQSNCKYHEKHYLKTNKEYIKLLMELN